MLHTSMNLLVSIQSSNYLSNSHVLSQCTVLRCHKGQTEQHQTESKHGYVEDTGMLWYQSFSELVIPRNVAHVSLCLHLLMTLLQHIHQGRIQKFQEGGSGSQILERGGQKSTFQCGFQSFSYKSVTIIPPKGGAAACPAPPLNPCLYIEQDDCTPEQHDTFYFVKLI